MGLFQKLFGKSASKTGNGFAVVVGNRYRPSQEMVQRLSSDGHLEGCSNVSTIEDPKGWTSDEEYKAKAIAAAVMTARRKGVDPSKLSVITQYGEFPPRLGGRFYVVRFVAE